MRISPPSEGDIWTRLLGPGAADIPPEAARFLLGLSFGEEDNARMHELAAKARAGTLTPAERDETASYERAGALLSLLKAKARLALKNGQAS